MKTGNYPAQGFIHFQNFFLNIGSNNPFCLQGSRELPLCGEVPALKGTDSAFLRCFRGQAGDGLDPGDESRLGVLADQEPEQAGF